MRKYILTSPRFNGTVTFGYDANDSLVFYHNECDNEAAINWLKNNLPVSEQALKELKKNIDGSIQEVPQDLSFDTFWDTYDQKINRKRVEPLWKKLSDANKMLAIMKVKSYDAYINRKGIGKANPDNYLSREYFLTDWAKQR